MPTRLILTFPGTPERPDDPIVFECVSGDYDPGPERDAATWRVLTHMSDFTLDDPRFPLTTEDV